VAVAAGTYLHPGLTILLLLPAGWSLVDPERRALYDIVCGTRSYHRLPELVATAQAGERAIQLDTEGEPDFVRDVTQRPAPFQAQVTVVRGCTCRASRSA